jgi:hypothetical protein
MHVRFAAAAVAAVAVVKNMRLPLGKAYGVVVVPGDGGCICDCSGDFESCQAIGKDGCCQCKYDDEAQGDTLSMRREITIK